MGTVSLDAAIAAHHQATSDLSKALDDAMSGDRISERLAMTTVLGALRYIEKNGLTEAGRKQLRTAIEATRAVMGVE